MAMAGVGRVERRLFPITPLKANACANLPRIFPLEN